MCIEMYREKYLKALQGIPATGDGFNTYLLRVTNPGVRCGLGPDEIKNDIREKAKPGNREITEIELDRAINTSLNTSSPDRTYESSGYTARKLQNAIDPDIVERLKYAWINEGSKVISHPEDLMAISPVKLTGHPIEDCLIFLDTLYTDDEYIFIGDTYHTDVRQVIYWKAYIERHGIQPWPHFIPNPMTGEQHKTKENKLSRRCDASVSSYRFVVSEFDNMTWLEQLSFWVGCPLPVSALIYSGGKSYHALIRIDEDTQMGWGLLVKGRIRPLLSMMGADPATFNPSCLSRTPGHIRAETRQWQQLLYLDPNPVGGILECRPKCTV